MALLLALTGARESPIGKLGSKLEGIYFLNVFRWIKTLTKVSKSTLSLGNVGRK
jgi:hypothetical protein